MLYLLGGGLEVALVGCLHLHSCGVHLNALAAIEANVIDVHDGVFRHDGSVLVNIDDMYAAKVRHGTVISKYATTPLAADEADAAKAEAVVNPTIEPDMRAPVAGAPPVHSALVAPVARCPQKTGAGRLHPHARNPEVTRIPIGPVARSPEVARRGQGRLLIHRQGRRSNVNVDSDADLCLRHWQAKQRQHDQSSGKQIAKC